jgi:hypothetical protein
MTYSATFSQEVSSDEAQQPPGLKLRVTITGTTGFQDQGLFVLQSVDGITGFQYCAKPPDLQNLLVATPDPISGFLRASTYTVTCRDTTELDDHMAIIRGDLQGLCTQMKRLLTYASPISSTVTEA